ncbi:alpha/beta hydrolase [Maricaulis sp. CAU 1757]
MADANADAVHSFSGFQLDTGTGRLTRDGEDLAIRAKVYEFLRLLLESDGRLLSKSELIETLWPDRIASEDSLAQLARALRAALGAEAADIVVTVPKRGYRLGVPVATAWPGRVRRPDVKYALSGDTQIAYQVVGEGPIDLVYVQGWVSHLDYGWEAPSMVRFYEGLASFARLILFDKRGTGLSDRAVGLPSTEQRMDDVRAVMDAAGSKRAVILAMSEGGGMAMSFAAACPERVQALALFGVFARREWAADYPWAPTPKQRALFYRDIREYWGRPIGVDTMAPSLADNAEFRDWWAVYQRRSASPGAALDLARMNTLVDVRDVLKRIKVPTLLMHRVGDREVAVEEARYLARCIPDATLLELPGEDHLIFAGDVAAVVDAVQGFVAGLR